MKSTDPFFLHVNSFLERLRLELKSDRTISTYSNAILGFRRYVEVTLGMDVTKLTFDNISDDMVRNYLKHVMDSGLSMATRNIRLISIKEYIRFCSENDLSLLPLLIKVSKIKAKKVPVKKHNWISLNQVKLLLKQPSRNRTGIRDRFIMLMLFSTGMRLSELLDCRLNSMHLDGDEPFVFVVRKGNKPRTIPLTKETVENIVEYKRLFHRGSDKDEYLIFTERDGKKHRMSQDNVQRIVTKYAKQARLEDETFPDLHPHMLRHSYGAILYRSNMSKAEIAKLLGHTNESTTEIYVETDVDMIRSTLKSICDGGEEDIFKSLSPTDKAKLKGK